MARLGRVFGGGAALLRAGRRGPLGAIALFCALIPVAIGGETARLTVVNATSHVLRVIIADRAPLDLAPGGRTTFESGRAVTVSVRASYAPDQGVEGSATRMFHVSAEAGASAGGGYVYFACRTGGPIVAPAHAGPTVWSVTADTLAGAHVAGAGGRSVAPGR